jgi:hypothetical protein
LTRRCLADAWIAVQHQALNGYEPKWFQSFSVTERSSRSSRSIASLRSNRLRIKRISDEASLI